MGGWNRSEAGLLDGPVIGEGDRHEGRATDRNRARLSAGCRSGWRRPLARLDRPSIRDREIEAKGALKRGPLPV
jgi:hypothetical protein